MPRRRKPPTTTPSKDAAWLAHLDAECGRAIARHMKGAVNLERPIKSLTLEEFKGMAAAASAQWIVTVSNQIAAESKLTPEEIENYKAILFA